MEQEQNNTQPAQEPVQPVQSPVQNAFPSADEKSGTSNYAIIGGLIGLVIIALGGWYVMKDNDTSVATPSPIIPEIVITPTTDPEVILPSAEAVADQVATNAAVETLRTQGTSIDLSAIESDLNATNLDSLNDINKI